MAQFYTLEEAARVLGMDPEVLKSKANANEIRPYRDGGTLRFKVADIDEFARIKGLGSEPDLHLSDLDIPANSQELSEFEMNSFSPDYGQTMEFTPKGPGAGSRSDHDVLIDDLSVPPNPISGSSSVILGMEAAGKLPSDSDVRLVPDNPKGASDSDVRLAGNAGFKAPSDSDVTLIADDTSSHEALEAGSSDTAVRRSPLIGSSGEVHAESGSDFELTPSSVIDALQPDSGSDFELSAVDEGSDEFESTPLKRPSDSDVTAGTPGLSGINLSRPSDSGINLQSASGLNLSQSIELSPISGEAIPSAPRAKPKPKSKSSLSETPVPGVGKGDKDIFDDTDFEVDALSSDSDDSDDKTMQLEAASDFELEESDTGSEVFAIDEDDVDQNAATSVGSPVDLGDDDDDVDEFAEGASGEMSAGAWDVESESSSVPSSSPRSAPSPMMAAQGPSAEWGGLWIGMLSVTAVFMLLLAFVSMDLVRNLYDFHQEGPASGLVKSIAGLIGR